MYKVFSPILYLNLACKQLCFPPAGGINRRNESTRTQLLLFFVVLIIISSILIPYIVLFETVKTQIDFIQQKIIKY